MKLKNVNTETSKKEGQIVRKFSTSEEALKSKHDFAREFFKKIELSK